MRGISVFLYSVKQGIKSMRKNRMFTLASIGTMAACLFLFGMFYFIVSNFNHMVKEVETSVGVTVFFEEGISQEQIDSIGEAIKAREEVDHMDFISAEKAWDQFVKDNFKENPELVNSFGTDNPLKDSASWQVFIKDISAQEEVAAYIETIEGVRLVKRSDDTAKGLENANKLISYISIAIILILLAVSIFLINSTISTGITVRRAEIGIMRLMGASDFFIRAPFIVEGVVIGIIGASIPLVILVVSYDSIINYINNKFQLISNWLTFLEAAQIFSILIPLCLLIGIGIGFLGSFFTVRKHLNI
ncbi:MAG: ABC transporter permease [Eubacterium sp.]|jgi:cell division transport system permease protein|nr:ABC transporter permease [Eubacterium sp.]